MYLKSLKISGFKSFAKSVTLDFPKGITVIAGPNGSGKSNVVDAIRWAMAEQSFKNLRGKKGEDLIFYGGINRNSLSQASVAMAFDMAGGPGPASGWDFSEAVLERVVHKTGENDYILNSRKVRLSDLEIFLAQSRIGDSSFRVISQGMADKFLNLSPQEFRGFIEEAAGVKEYQDKKHQAVLRLRSTDENLSKVAVILAELTPQLKVLKREKEKLSKKEAYLAELKELSHQFFGARYQAILISEQKLSQKKHSLKQQIKPLTEEVKKLREDLFSFDKKNTLHSEIAKLSFDIRHLEQENNKIAREIISQEGRINLQEDREKQKLPVSVDYLKEKINGLVSAVNIDFKGADPEAMRHLLAKVLRALQDLLGAINSGVASAADPNTIPILQHGLQKLLTVESDLKNKIDSLVLTRNEKEKFVLENRRASLTAENSYRGKEVELVNLENLLRQTELEEEKLKLHQDKFYRDINTVGVITLADILSGSDKQDNKFKVALASHNEADLVSLEDKIFKLKNKLDETGSIDASVVKEYEGVNDRFMFLSKEHGDLSATLTSLNEMVKDLDHQVEARYKNTIAEMSHVFGGYFRLIFGGGKAGLVQSRKRDNGNQGVEGVEENGGVEIKLELPNKKIKSLHTLSGGERTLTSIALLFALASIRKPPVMVLDEIDAALDETNTQKFVRLVKELSKNTQFIIVTHNRETMRGADALYGVSMKDGISHLLSLKLQP